MSLLVLPIDLQRSIAEYLLPNHCFSLACASREIYHFLRDLLAKHARLFEQYSVIDTAGAGPLLWDVLADVLDDPRKGWYIRELNLPGYREVERQQPIALKALESIEVAAAALASFYRRQRGGRSGKDSHPVLESKSVFIDIIRNGKDLPVIVLLLYNLPYLATLRMTVGPQDWGILADFLDCCTLIPTDPAIAQLLPLKRLKSAAIAHWDTENSCSFDWVSLLIRFPSVRTIAAQLMGGGTYRLENPVSCQPLGRDLEEFCFIGCQLDLDELRCVLDDIKALRTFTYTSGGAIVDEHLFKPRKIIAALIEHAYHSLERLVLEDWTDDKIPENQRWRNV